MQSGDVGVGLALPGVLHGECGTRGRRAVPLQRKALRTSGFRLVSQCPYFGAAALPAVRVVAAPSKPRRGGRAAGLECEPCATFSGGAPPRGRTPFGPTKQVRATLACLWNSAFYSEAFNPLKMPAIVCKEG